MTSTSLRALIAALITAAMLAVVPAAHAQSSAPPPYTTTFQDSFEGLTFPQVYNTGAWNAGVLLNGTGSYASQVTPTGYAATNGTKVMESGVTGTGGEGRAELQCHRSAAPACSGAEGSEWVYEWDLRVPSGQTLATTGVPSVMQTKPSSGPNGENSCFGGSMIAEQVTDTTKFALTRWVRGGVPTNLTGSCTVPNDQRIPLVTLSRDTWHHIAFHAKWSPDGTVGFEEIWVDGVNVMAKRFMQNFVGGGRYMMFRLGVYSVPNSNATKFQYDNVKVGIPSATTDTTITAGPSGATNNASPSFSFTSNPAGGTFECKLDGPGSTVGTWGACSSPKAYSALAQGSYTFSVRATVGGVTDPTPATRTFTVDTAAPDTSITAGPSGATNSTAPSFSFSSTESGSTFQCKLDGPGTTVGTWGSCTSPKAYSALAQGSYTFSVRATDAAGNQDGTPATRAFTVDTTAPDTTINSGPTGTITVNSASFGFSSETGATFECKLDGPGTTVGTWGSCTSPKSYSALANGSYTFNVRARDAAGNTDASPATRAFTVNVSNGCDQTASPSGPITTPAGLISALSAGQTGCFRAGTYGSQSVEISVNKDVTLQSYPGESATLVGRIVIPGAGAGATLRDLTLKGMSTSHNPSPTINAANVTLADNDISHRDPANPGTNAGICVSGSTWNGTSGDNAIIERNRIHDCGRLPASNHDHGIYLTDTDGVIIRNNVIFDNADRGIQLYPDATNTQVYNNTVDGNGQGIIISNNSANNTVYNNIFSNATIRFNVEQNSLVGTGNVVRDSCLWASTGDPWYDQNGGLDPNVEPPEVTVTNLTVANPNYVNRAGKDFRDTNSACAGYGAPDDVATP
jgi:parallel beta-helix repeat protein